MVTVNRNDLEFILQQIKIAEADARGEPILGTYLPTSELPWGLRRVDGSNNNLNAGQGSYGSAGQEFPRATTPTWVNEGDDAMVFGPPIRDANGAPIDFGFPGVPVGYIPQNNGLGPDGTDLPATYLTNNDYQIRLANNPALGPRAIQPGDVVEVRDTDGAPLELWQNGDWSVPWRQWVVGSATGISPQPVAMTAGGR